MEESTKNKIRDSMPDRHGENNPMYKHFVSEETRQKHSDATKGEKNPMFGVPKPQETIDKMKGAWDNEKRENSSTNVQGVKQKKGCSSEYVGVGWCKATQCWISKITHMGVRYYLGEFDNEENAAIAYNKKAIELFGENAKLNIIKDDKNE